MRALRGDRLAAGRNADAFGRDRHRRPVGNGLRPQSQAASGFAARQQHAASVGKPRDGLNVCQRPPIERARLTGGGRNQRNRRRWPEHHRRNRAAVGRQRRQRSLADSDRRRAIGLSEVHRVPRASRAGALFVDHQRASIRRHVGYDRSVEPRQIAFPSIARRQIDHPDSQAEFAHRHQEAAGAVDIVNQQPARRSHDDADASGEIDRI